MPPVLDSLIPVFLVISLGWVLKASGFITQEQWSGLERVTYYIFIPALVITTLAGTDLSRVPVVSMGVALLAPLGLITLVFLLIRIRLEQAFGITGPAFTSVLQGAIRWNSFIALALASAMHGREGLTIVAVCMAFLFPSANLISAYSLSRYASATPLKPLAFAMGLIKNPFIWSTAVGMLIAVIGLPIPKPLMTFGDITGRAVLAAGLLLVGAGLELGDLRRPGAALWISVAAKLAVYPLLAGIIGQAMGLTGATLTVSVIAAAVPTASTAYILARQAGGDAPLMASIITVQTIAAAITMPVMLWIFS
jgi:malonate transporter and related proteins